MTGSPTKLARTRQHTSLWQGVNGRTQQKGGLVSRHQVLFANPPTPSSDGLWDFATDERVMHITLKQPQRTPDEICNALIREARMGGSEDDCTIVVVKYVVCGCL